LENSTNEASSLGHEISENHCISKLLLDSCINYRCL